MDAILQSAQGLYERIINKLLTGGGFYYREPRLRNSVK